MYQISAIYTRVCIGVKQTRMISLNDLWYLSKIIASRTKNEAITRYQMSYHSYDHHRFSFCTRMTISISRGVIVCLTNYWIVLRCVNGEKTILRKQISNYYHRPFFSDKILKLQHAFLQVMYNISGFLHTKMTDLECIFKIGIALFLHAIFNHIFYRLFTSVEMYCFSLSIYSA